MNVPLNDQFWNGAGGSPAHAVPHGQHAHWPAAAVLR